MIKCIIITLLISILLAGCAPTKYKYYEGVVTARGIDTTSAEREWFDMKEDDGTQHHYLITTLVQEEGWQKCAIGKRVKVTLWLTDGNDWAFENVTLAQEKTSR